MEKLEEQQEEKEKRNYWIYLFLFTILFFFCVFGMTYSIYNINENPDNQLETGQIIFTYSDVNQSGNGISIEKAVPIPDSLGKAMVGRNQYFDFYITTTTKNSDIEYKILLKKDESSTLGNDKVRIYLTQLMGGYEQELVLTDFSKLSSETIEDQDYYVLYTKDLRGDLDNYSDSFRLRMWVNENAVHYEDQFFSTKVDVYAYQIEKE